MNIFLIISIISFILFIISLLIVIETFIESEQETPKDIFPITKIVDNPYYGKIKCFNNNDLVSNSILKGEIWENDIYQNIFKKYVKENVTILDCGTYIGSHTILLSKLNPNNDIIGFEMMPEHYKLLVDNIKLNNLENVLVFNTALDEKVGFTQMPNKSYIENGVNFGAISLLSEKTNIKIPTLTLDYILPFINESKPVQFIKIDVEGYEINLLNGAKELLKKYKPTILIEIWNGTDKFTKSDIWTFLVNLNYKLKSVEGDDYLLYIPGQFPDLL